MATAQLIEKEAANLPLPATRRWRGLVVLAALFTLLNAFKPLQIDDSAYYYYALQAARDPLHPYGFEMFWYGEPEPANDILAPPVLSYWWAIAILMFGENVFLWKLWLFPFSMLFVWSLATLFRRFARGVELPLLWLTVLSPTFLPSLNLMLDVPALALALGAVAVFTRSAVRDSLGWAILAGLLAGLAMQTKYTGFLAPVVIVLYGCLFRHRITACAAALVAAFLFVAWEWFVVQQHGHSHFMFHVHQSDEWIMRGRKVGWWEGLQIRLAYKIGFFAMPLLPTLGGVCPALIALNFAALRRRSWVVGVTGACLLLGYLLIALVQATFVVEARTLGNENGPHLFGPDVLGLAPSLFGLYGLLFLGSVFCVAWRLLPGRRDEPATGDEPAPSVDAGTAAVVWEPADTDQHSQSIRVKERANQRLEPFDGQTGPAPREINRGWPATLLRWFFSASRRINFFLVLWFGLELAGYFALTPFCAVRRVMGVVVVATLLAGRLASRTCTRSDRHALVWGVAGGGIALGLMFYAVDLGDAVCEKNAAEEAARIIRAHDPDARIWYVGHWGFQHYAEREGMIPVVPTKSRLRAGDWLVKPDWRLNQQMIREDWLLADPPLQCIIDSPVPVPLRTVSCFYGGHPPIEHHEGPRVTVYMYHITADCVPQHYWSGR